MDFRGKMPLRGGMPRRIRILLCLLCAAIVTELTVCQASFWGTFFAEEEDVWQRTEVLCGRVSMEEMETRQEGTEGTAYEDEDGFLHVSDGAVLLRLTGWNAQIRRLHIDAELPEGEQVVATVFAQDEGNGYVYQLGEGRTLLREVPQNAWMKVYPYGKVKNLYIRLENAAKDGEGGTQELVLKLNGLTLNGRIPFVLRPVRAAVLFALYVFLYASRKKSGLHGISFQAEEENRAGRKKRVFAAACWTALLVLAAAFFVRVNPQCRQNPAPHHAQYQELARALADGRVSVGEGSSALLEVENPYDTISLQAGQIPYQADYAYYDGRYYVYFGIVPELLLYFPFYMLTGRDLPNYVALFAFFAGFLVAAAALVWELMKRFFPKAPFWLWGAGVFLLTASYSNFYMLIRPDLYEVPIVASCFFTTAGLWAYLAGLNRERKKPFWYALGSFCLALNAGCRPQFLVFLFLAVSLFWEEVFGKRALFSKKKAGDTLAFVLPYLMVAAGILYYNGIRFGSPFDFGATYSMTSNDMTHRGFNLERVLYGLWYFLFEPVQLEAAYPYLQSAAIRTDYLGKMVTESCFGGVFACSLLAWPVFSLYSMKKSGESKTAAAFATGSFLAALLICAVDATGAGILIRYSADVSYGIFLAAFVALCWLAQRAGEKKVYGAFVSCFRAAALLHAAFLFLVFINADGSVNLMRGNPALYYTIQAVLRW